MIIQMQSSPKPKPHPHPLFSGIFISPLSHSYFHSYVFTQQPHPLLLHPQLLPQHPLFPQQKSNKNRMINHKSSPLLPQHPILIPPIKLFCFFRMVYHILKRKEVLLLINSNQNFRSKIRY